MGSSAVLQLAARRTCSVSVEEWDSACSRTARVPPRAGCRLIYRCRMGFWEASCRGTGAADGTFDSSTPATCGRRGADQRRFRPGAAARCGCGCRALGTGQRMTRLLYLSSCAPPASALAVPGTLSRARSGTGTDRHRHQLLLQLRRAQQLLRVPSCHCRACAGD